jgi:hypothetical protein
VNDNLLRDALAGPLLPLRDSCVVVPDGPGLGYVPDIASIASLHVDRFEIVLQPETTMRNRPT